jgi:tetratricopeptide (TPR) repeat protein
MQPPAPPIPAPEKPALKHPMLAPAVLLVANVVTFFLAARLFPALFQTPATLFRQTATGWEPAPPPPARPREVRVSNRGTVWISTSGGGFSRFDGSEWTSYPGKDIGVRSGFLSGGFVLDGEDVWAVSPEGALHWDGRIWHCHRDAVATETACSIAAAGGRAWIVDSHGNFSSFDGARWTIRKLDLPGVRWNTEHESWPKLARTADGALWLMRTGLWRFDGTRWTPVSSPGRSLRDAELLTATQDRLWLDDHGKLRSVSADGQTWVEYAPPSAVHEISSAAGRTCFSLSDGIVEAEGTGWRRLPFPGNGMKFIDSIALAPGGRLWAVAEPDARQSVRRTAGALAALMLLLLLALIATLVWMSRRRSRSQRQKNERILEAMRHATGEVPDELKEALDRQTAKTDPWRTGLILGLALVGGSVAFFLLRRKWPEAPAWLIPLLAVAIHLVVTALQSLVKRRPLPSDPIGPGGPSRYDWGKTGKALAAAAVLVLALSANHIPLLRPLQGYGLLLLILVPFLYQLLAIRLMEHAMWRADYDAALKAIRLFHFVDAESAAALRRRGYVFLCAGRCREAEDSLRRAAAKQRTGFDYAVTIEFLADTLMEQGRNGEALRSYQAALHALPGFRRPYRGMAELTLRLGNNPPQALEYVESAVSVRRFSLRDRFLRGRSSDDYWALRAWALGQLGRSGEVAPAIENALKATNQKSRVDMAATTYRAGMAMRAMGDETAATRYFKRTLELDPHGRRGTLAQAALGRRSVWA